MEVELPSGKYPASIDVSVTPNTVVYATETETDSDKISNLQTQIYNLTEQLITGGVI